MTYFNKGPILFEFLFQPSNYLNEKKTKKKLRGFFSNKRSSWNRDISKRLRTSCGFERLGPKRNSLNEDAYAGVVQETVFLFLWLCIIESFLKF